MHLPAFIHFPWLHPRLAPPRLPVECAFLDPGMSVAGGQYRTWRPQWPYTDAQVQRIVEEYLRRATESAHPSDLVAHLAMGVDDLYSDSSMEIRAQLTGWVVPGDAEENHLRQAQVFLALELTRERAMVDLMEQQQRLDQAQHQWRETLGLEGNDLLAPEAVGLAVASPAKEWDWRPLLGIVDSVLPPSVPLLVADPEVVAQWRAAGVGETPADEPGLAWCRLEGTVVRALGIAPRGEMSGRNVALVISRGEAE